MTPTAQESISLPTRPLIAVALGGPAAMGVLWLGASFIGSWGQSGRWPGMLALGVIAAVSLITTWVLRPWHARPILIWGGLLIAASTARIIGTLATCLLLYSAARQPAGPLLFGAMAGLIAVLVGETRVAAARFRQANT